MEAAPPTFLQRVALAAGFWFLAFEVAGFVPGLVAHYRRMTFAGRSSGAELLGVFTVWILLDALHLLIGLLVLALARDRARDALLAGGVGSLALFVYGADNRLHLASGLALVAMPFARR